MIADGSRIRTPEPRAVGARGLVPAALAAVALAAGVFEFVGNPELHKLPWSDTGLRRLVVCAAVFTLLALVRSLARARVWSFWLAVAAIYGAAVVGIGPFAACALFAISATALGSAVLRDSLAGSAAEIPCCLCLGEALLGFAACLLGNTYLCYPVTFLFLLLAPIVWRRRWLVARVGPVWRTLGRAEESASETIAATLLAFAVAIQFLLVLKPEVGTDSLAMHLALPAYVAIHHHWPADVHEFLWALMPQTVDWCYTLAYSLGGDSAARLLNFANLVAALAILYALARQSASRAVVLLVCALFATGPLVQVVTGSLFIENTLAALLMASMATLWLYAESGKAPLWAAACLLFGGSLSAKAGALAFLPGMAALAAYGLRKHRARTRAWFAWASAGLAIGAYFYALAWIKTGNPFFPGANEIFRSKLIPTARVAGQFRQPLTWRTLANVTFHSSQYSEGTDGSAGFQYFLLLPAAMAVLAWRRQKAIVWYTALGLSAALLAYLQIAYLRYLYAPLLLLMAPVALWLEEQRQGRRAVRWFAYAMVAVAAAANLLFQASSGWYHCDFVWNQIFHPEGAAEYLEASAPARIIIEVLNRIAPGEPALFCQYDHVAGFRGAAYSTNWHMLLRHEGLLDLREGIDVLQYVNQRSIRYIAAPCPEDLDTWPRVLPVFFADFAEPVFQPGRWALYRVKPEFSGAAGMERARALVANPPVAGAGKYDDTDVRVVRQGDWFRDFCCAQAFGRSLSTSRTAGAGLRFTFDGAKAAFFFPRGPNFGIVEVLVDGERKTMIDEYAAAPAFGLSLVVETPAGVHTLALRATGRKNAASGDDNVAVDGFQVWR